MRSKPLIILAALVMVLGAYIYFYERHQLTTSQTEDRAAKVLPDLEEDDIQAISITNPAGTIRLAKDGETWRLTEPIDFPADQGKVTSLLTSLLGLKAERRLSSTEVDPSLHGLNEPKLRVTLSTKAGDTEIAIGNETALGSQRALALGDDEILMCNLWFTADLERAVDEWRSTKVLSVREADLSTIEVDSTNEQLSLVQLDGSWQLVKPVADLADQELVRNLVTGLNGLEIKQFASGDESAAELGLATPRYRVTLGHTSGDEPTTLELGARRTLDDATEVACRRQGEFIGWVSDSAEAPLGRAAIRWRSKVVAPFDSWEVTKISFSRADETVTLQREQGLWQLEDGTEVASTPVSERIATLTRLQALEYDLVDMSTAEYGRIELWLDGFGDKENSRQLSFVFAEPMSDGGNYLVKASSRATLMSVAREDVEGLFADLEQLKSPVLPPPAAEGSQETTEQE